MFLTFIFVLKTIFLSHSLFLLFSLPFPFSTMLQNFLIFSINLYLKPGYFLVKPVSYANPDIPFTINLSRIKKKMFLLV